MTTFKKVLVVTAMVLAIVGMVASVAGLIGVWAINAPLTRSATSVLTGLATTLQVADSGITQASDGLAVARDVVGTVMGITSSAGDTLDQSRVNELATLVQGRLTDAVATLNRANQTIVGTVEAINGVVGMVNRVPGVQIEPIDPEEINKVTELITGISEALDRVVNAIESVRSGVAGAIANLKEAITGLGDRLSSLTAALARVQPQVRQALDRVNALIPQVAGLIDFMSVGATLLCLWLGFAQFGLFMWMRSIYRAIGG